MPFCVGPWWLQGLSGTGSRGAALCTAMPLLLPLPLLPPLLQLLQLLPLPPPLLPPLLPLLQLPAPCRHRCLPTHSCCPCCRGAGSGGSMFFSSHFLISSWLGVPCPGGTLPACRKSRGRQAGKRRKVTTRVGTGSLGCPAQMGTPPACREGRGPHM